MKKLAIVAMFAILIFTMCTMVAHAEEYPNAGIITKTDWETDTVYVTTFFDDNVWTFEGIEDFSIGDIVALIMDNVNTDIIYDDVIIMVKYLGWVA